MKTVNEIRLLKDVVLATIVGGDKPDASNASANGLAHGGGNASDQGKAHAQGIGVGLGVSLGF